LLIKGIWNKEIKGIRNKEVLSPYLFAVYLDKLLIQLGSAESGLHCGKFYCESSNICLWYRV